MPSSPLPTGPRPSAPQAQRLVDRSPRVPPERLVAELVPPPQFDRVRFETYRPDPAQPSQAEAVDALVAFAGAVGAPPPRQGLFRRSPAAPVGPSGVYLDGGFGVGKTHLLASLWHAAPGPKAFSTFVGLTNMVGALGFTETVQALSGHALVCIDEFELDDPGDTVLVSTLLARLVDSGVRLAATSNTLPGSLGEGRFATQDFLREIQGLSAHFQAVRIDGEDYRHRGMPEAPEPYAADVVARVAASRADATLDAFGDLVRHLAELHPSRYAALLDGVGVVCLTDVVTVTDQNEALRLVVLADRLYDGDLPVVSSGVPFDAVFSQDMLAGGYRKKYHRAVSRLDALAREGQRLVDALP